MSFTRRDFNRTALAALGSLTLHRATAAEQAVNRRIVLASRPAGMPTLDNFRLETVPVPQPAEGEVLLKTRFLSLDPYMRGRMSAAESYAESVPVDGVMVGGTVSQVVSSRHSDYREATWSPPTRVGRTMPCRTAAS